MSWLHTQQAGRATLQPMRAPVLTPAEIDRLAQALGQALVHCWSRLPRDVQQDLFEAAVAAEGESIRQRLAIYLHGTHARTIHSLQARAMPEPDSLGG